MVLITKDIKNKIVLITLALIYSILLIEIGHANRYSYYYNKIYILNTTNILSAEYSSLIIATVTGDQIGLDSDLKKMYSELQIKHLLVLSGSNLLIFYRFIFLRNYIHKLSYFLLYYYVIICYLFYVNFLHPITRAFIFMLLQDFYTYQGYKVGRVEKLSLLLLTTIAILYLLNFSNSFLLSAIYYFLIALYQALPYKNNFLNKLFFPFYMTVASIPVYYYFFGNINLISLLISNLLIAPFYDFFVFIMYLTYIIGFYPEFFHPFLLFSQHIYHHIYTYLEFINYLNQYIMHL